MHPEHSAATRAQETSSRWYSSQRGVFPALQQKVCNFFKAREETQVRKTRKWKSRPGLLVPLRWTCSLSQAGHPSHHITSYHTLRRWAVPGRQARNTCMCLRTHRAQAGEKAGCTSSRAELWPLHEPKKVLGNSSSSAGSASSACEPREQLDLPLIGQSIIQLHPSTSH